MLRVMLRTQRSAEVAEGWRQDGGSEEAGVKRDSSGKYRPRNDRFGFCGKSQREEEPRYKAARGAPDEADEAGS